MKKITTVLIALSLFTSCDSFAKEGNEKEIWLNNFRGLVREVEMLEQVPDSTWRRFDAEYRQLNEIEAPKFARTITDAEYNEVVELRERFHARRIRSKAVNVIHDGIRTTKQFLNELMCAPVK